MPTRRPMKKTPTRAPVRGLARLQGSGPRRTPPGGGAPSGGAAAAQPAGLTEVQIRSILRFHLKNLSTSGAPTTDDTVFSGALSDLSIGGMSARVLFKAVSRRDIVINGGIDKPWPSNWLTLTVATLAPKLVA